MRISLHPKAASEALRERLAVVVPVYNEEANIRSVVKEWTEAIEALEIKFQFLLINDGSKDNTLAVLHELEAAYPDRLIVIDKPNSGHGRSCRLGYDSAVASEAVEWVLQIDSDGQCDPRYFADFWRASSEADCIFGRRTQRDDGFARMLTSRICRIGATLIGGCEMVDPNVPYRLMRKPILRAALTRIPPAFNIHNVALTYVLKKTAGIRWAYIPIRFRQRQGGENSINLINVSHLGVDMLLELRKLK